MECQKNLLDKNHDNALQYILLEGDTANSVAQTRTEGAISTLNSLGIKIQKLQSVNTYWNKDLARLYTENSIIRYANNIEAIIANNDYIAIGAIEALQKYGYNTGNKLKHIPVFGIDGTEEATALVDKNTMAGTVIEDNIPYAKAIYEIGINLINNSPPTKNTPYKIINGKISIPLVYSEYIPHTSS
ncbi:substrate-binding domain-containing protein [Clostridium cellulovorans]|uniref:substrate-binding domain-containing protein n=1 Tax=Clostridium cellulovorans TaxID=1493 RepID=UPI0001A978AF|nr:substrate-binding domain-containing protein [Clostridium cellulovorans]